MGIMVGLKVYNILTSVCAGGFINDDGNERQLGVGLARLIVCWVTG